VKNSDISFYSEIRRWGYEDVDLAGKLLANSLKVIRPKLESYFHLQRKGPQLLAYRQNKNKVQSFTLPRAPFPIIYHHISMSDDVRFLMEMLHSNMKDLNLEVVEMYDVQYYPSTSRGSSKG